MRWICLQVAMATKKQLIAIKGISEVKAEKMLKAAREMVNVGFTTVGTLNAPVIHALLERQLKMYPFRLCGNHPAGGRSVREQKGPDHTLYRLDCAR